MCWDLGHPRRRSAPALEEIPDLLDIESEDTGANLPDHGKAIDQMRVKVAGFRFRYCSE